LTRRKPPSPIRSNVPPCSRPSRPSPSRLYSGSDERFASHETVKHSAGEYVRGDVHTNSAEGFFSIFKRGMTGIYQHCDEKHLHRYLTEYQLRYNNRVKLGVSDIDRTIAAVRGIEGKRLELWAVLLLAAPSCRGPFKLKDLRRHGDLLIIVVAQTPRGRSLHNLLCLHV
jgi:hypothetical protein